MPYDNDPSVDWSTGAILLRNGTIYCSPNSKRAVSIPDTEARVIPPQAPFTGPLLTESLGVDYFQPVWWNWNWGVDGICANFPIFPFPAISATLLETPHY